jgi:hypothetical protein
MKNNNENVKPDAATVKMIRGWLAKDGSIERTANWMARNLHIGGVATCRALIFAAIDDEAMPAENN